MIPLLKASSHDDGQPGVDVIKHFLCNIETLCCSLQCLTIIKKLNPNLIFATCNY